MKKLLFILLVFILLISCRVRIDEDKTIYVVDTIDSCYSYELNYKLKILLRRLPYNASYKNQIDLYSNDYSIKVGDKFKLIKIEENKK